MIKNKYSLKILVIVAFFSIFGCIMVYSASKYAALNSYNDASFYLKKQVVGVCLGGILFYVFSVINLNILKKFSVMFVAVAVVSLCLVFVPGIGVENYGAKRWVKILFFTFQPSEVAKLAFIIFSASYLSKLKDDSFRSFLPILLIGAVFCGLIIIEPNMSITFCFAILVFVVIVVGGMKGKHLLALIIPAAIALPLLIILEPYRFSRLLAFIDPFKYPKGEGFQLIQSLFSLSSGGLFGVGLFNSRQALRFLPFSESDFIFSIICEEFGIIGGAGLLLLFFMLFYYGYKIALSAKDKYESYLAFFIVSLIFVQVIINVAVVTGSIPPTGLPLPFISAGNTQILVNMSMGGILLNISKRIDEQKISYFHTI